MPALGSPSDIYRVRTSAKNMIKRALRLIGALGTGEELSAAALSEALEALNALVDSWNTEKLTVFAVARNTATLTAGQQSHTIGPTAELDMPRPQTMEQGNIFISGGALGTEEIELRVLTQTEYAAIPLKDTSRRPTDVYYETSFPLGTVWLYPKPDAAYTFIVYGWQLLPQITMDSVASEWALPSGYTDAITHALAIVLAPEHGKAGAEILLTIAARAIETKANLKRLNQRPLTVECDPAIVEPGCADITSGQIL